MHASERERMHAKEQEVAKADAQHCPLAHADGLHTVTTLPNIREGPNMGQARVVRLM